MTPNAAENLVTGHTSGALLAKRVRKARHQSCCARCGRLIIRGERIGLVEELGWVHVSPSCAAVAESFGAFTVEARSA